MSAMGTGDIHLPALLDSYDIGDIRAVSRAAGGTAGRAWHLSTAGGEFLLRLRGLRTSTKTRLAFDHGLRAHLVARGVPTVCPVLARDGHGWVRWDGRIFELFPYVRGRLFCPDQVHEVASAARALACFHEAASDFRPDTSEASEIIDQYSVLGFADGTSDRMHDPNLHPAILRGLRALATTQDDLGLIDRCLSRIEGVIRAYTGPPYDRLTGWVVHGDYTPANLLFSEGGEVVGIFDFDWSLPGARCLDLAEGLYFFATEPRQIDPLDIWSLTDAAAFAMDRCLVFFQAYQSVSPLTPAEIEALPAAFAAVWFSIRLEGTAKVGQSERLRFFSREIDRPLLWLDRNWPHLRHAIEGR